MISYQDVSHAYDHATALDHVSLEIAAGETVALIGPSGCGKSTLLKLAVGLLTPGGGRVLVGGRELQASNVLSIRRRLGYVIQSGGLFPHSERRRQHNARRAPLRRDSTWTAARLKELADLVRLPAEMLRRHPGDLSGGQRQRVSLMRALMLDPDVLLLDEPLGALDPMVRYALQEDLRALFERLRKSVLLVTHDLAEAAFFAERLVLMRDGRIAQQGGYRDLVRFAGGGVRARVRQGAATLRCVGAAARRTPRCWGWLRCRLRMSGPTQSSSAPKSSPSRSSSRKSPHSCSSTPAMRANIDASSGARESCGARCTRGDIDCYPEYSGTLRAEIFPGASIAGRRATGCGVGGRRRMGVPAARVQQYVCAGHAPRAGSATRIAADIAARCASGTAHRLQQRVHAARGWLARRARAVQLPHRDVRGLAHDLAYRGVADGAIDVTDLYSTDAEIAQYDLIALEDDRHFFPAYEALIVCRADVPAAARDAMQRLARAASMQMR